MGQQTYTEEELAGKKYNDLFKISKSLGIKTARRLKTDKLIEAILKCQQKEALATENTEASLSQDAKAVEEKKEGKDEAEEILSEIQFPDCGSLDSLNSLSDSADTSTGASVNHPEKGTSNFTPGKRHKRSGTYDVDEEEEEKKDEEKVKKKEEEQENKKEKKKEEEKAKEKEEEQENKKEKEEENKNNSNAVRKKRQRSSTFDLSPSDEVTLSIDEKERENLECPNQPTLNVTIRGSRLVSGNRKNSLRLSVTPSAKRRRESVTITPSAPAPALRPPRKSRGTPVGSPALTKAATTTTTGTSSKPVFTIGHGNAKVTEGAAKDGKHGTKGASTGIPRFLSYARRLKVPNFARIHEQAFQRMEGLDDYVDKRKVRQETIGSTAKKQQPKTKVFQPSITSVKNLNFNFAAESTSKDSNNMNGNTTQPDTLPAALGLTKPFNATPKPSPKSAMNNAVNSPRLSQKAPRQSLRPDKQMSTTKPGTARKSLRVPPKAHISPRSAKKTSPKTISGQTPKPGHKASPQPGRKSQISQGSRPSLKPVSTKTPKPGHKVSPQPGRKSQISQGSRPSLKPVSTKKVSTIGFPAFGSHLKENKKPGKQSVSSPMVSKQNLPKAVSPASASKRTQDNSRRGYVPYKGAVKPLKDRTDLKNVASRTHKVKSSKEIREGQRAILKGVRLNKRFELQMANRGITL